MSSGGMSGVTYASGTIYNVGTMCPANVNQGYACDGRNFGDKHLDAGKVSSFCRGHTGNYKQFGFGHGVTASQKCGECAQIRVPRIDGTYNYMTVMMVDHFTWSMEVGTTEIAYLVEGTKWVVGDRADFDYRIIGNGDCYASFGGTTGGGSNTPRPTPSSGGGGSGSNIKITNYGSSSGDWFYALKYSNVAAGYTISKIEILLSNGAWHKCDDQGWAVQCQTLPAKLTLPVSIRLTANGQTKTGNGIITNFNQNAVFNFGSNFGSTAPAPTPKPPTKRPPTSSGGSGSGSNVKITNYGSSSGDWFYALKYSTVAAGYTISKIEILLSNGAWHTCIDQGWAVQCQTLPAKVILPVSIRLTANGQTITGNRIITNFNANSVFDFGSNFGSTRAGPAPRSAPRPAPIPRKSPTRTSSGVRLVSYIGQTGTTWGTPFSNEGWLKYIGVPGYGDGSKGYNVLNFAFWVSNSNNGGAAANGAAYDWQNILSRVTSTSLRRSLTGTNNPSADQLRAGIKKKYAAAGIQIFISAFGGADHPKHDGKSATAIAQSLATYAKRYKYDGVDIDWEEGVVGELGANAGGETWLCTLTNRLRNLLDSNMKLTHAPQAPYFRCRRGDSGCNYPNGGYVTVDATCGSNIDWYNVQFYNQQTTTYADYTGTFVKSNGWSTNSAVYEIMNSGVPASKLVVGKHTQGDGSSFVSGANLRSMFNQAVSAGRWNAGFMSWQFYREVAFGSSSLIDQVKQVNGWGTTGGSTPTKPPPTKRPTTPSGGGSGSNIKITNYGSSSGDWFYALKYSNVAAGYTISKIEILLSNGAWHTCNDQGWAVQCQTLPAKVTLPVSIRLTANGQTITGNGIVTNFNENSVFDFGSNFGSTAPAPTTKPPTKNGGSGNGGGGNGNGCVITTRSGSSKWWCSVSVTNCGFEVNTVYIKGNGASTWTEGEYSPWSGGYYTFSKNAPYNGPLSFRIKAKTGQTVTGYNIIADASPGKSGTVNRALSALFAPYKQESVEEGESMHWTAIFAIILLVLVVIECIAGGIYMYRVRKEKEIVHFVDTETD